MAPLTARNARNCPEALKRPVRLCGALRPLGRTHRPSKGVRGAFKRQLNALKGCGA